MATNLSQLVEYNFRGHVSRHPLEENAQEFPLPANPASILASLTLGKPSLSTSMILVNLNICREKG
jgi:hypothetical protein